MMPMRIVAKKADSSNAFSSIRIKSDIEVSPFHGIEVYRRWKIKRGKFTLAINSHPVD